MDSRTKRLPRVVLATTGARGAALGGLAARGSSSGRPRCVRDAAVRPRPRAAAGAVVLGLAGRHLPRLPMQRVRAAPAAVLLELDAVGRVPLRLLGLVVAPLALGAGERDCDSDSALGHVFSRIVVELLAGLHRPIGPRAKRKDSSLGAGIGVLSQPWRLTFLTGR